MDSASSGAALLGTEYSGTRASNSHRSQEQKEAKELQKKEERVVRSQGNTTRVQLAEMLHSDWVRAFSFLKAAIWLPDL